METTRKVRICVPVCEQTVEAVSQASKMAAELGDLVEIRLDCVDPIAWKKKHDELQSVITNITVPVIQTLRPAEQGGQRELDHATRLHFGPGYNVNPSPVGP